MKRAYSIFAGCLILVIALLNFRVYHGQESAPAAPAKDVLPQLRHLSGKMRQGAAESMQSLFPEGYIFMNALYGLAWTDFARYAAPGDSLKREALAEAEWALGQIESEKGRETFNRELCPPYGIFYQGWRNLLRASIFRARPSPADSADRIGFETDSDGLVRCFQSQESPFLRSYDNAAWPADAFAAIASLAVYDKTASPRYKEFIEGWMQKTDSRRDGYTGLISHSVDPESGQPLEGARGSSQALILRMMAEVDGVRAARDYRTFRSFFDKSFLGLPGVSEYPRGKPGKGDVDSGPIPFGIGAAATIVAIGTARAIGDAAFARNVGGFVEAAGFPVEWSGSKWYGFGQLPIGDAFLCWSKATVPGAGSPGNGFRIPWLFHLAGAALIAILVLPVSLWRRRGQKS